MDRLCALRCCRGRMYHVLLFVVLRFAEGKDVESAPSQRSTFVFKNRQFCPMCVAVMSSLGHNKLVDVNLKPNITCVFFRWLSVVQSPPTMIEQTLKTEPQRGHDKGSLCACVYICSLKNWRTYPQRCVFPTIQVNSPAIPEVFYFATTRYPARGGEGTSNLARSAVQYSTMRDCTALIRCATPGSAAFVVEAGPCKAIRLW